MAEEKEDNKTCKNCKHFIQHYVRLKTHFYKTRCGHCGNYKLSNVKRRSLPIDGCGRWEQAEQISSADEIQKIANAVVSMQKHLRDIASILSLMKQE